MSTGICDWNYHSSKKKRKGHFSKIEPLTRTSMMISSPQRTPFNWVRSCQRNRAAQCTLPPEEHSLDDCLRQQRDLASPSLPAAQPVVATDSVILLGRIGNTSEMCSSEKMSSHYEYEDNHLQHSHQHHHHQVSSANYCEQVVSQRSSERWNRRRRRSLEDQTDPTMRRRRTGEGYGEDYWRTVNQSLLVVMVLLALVMPTAGRHYIAPGPCTWTHVSPFLSRDTLRLKSASSSLASFSSNHHHHLLSHSLSSSHVPSEHLSASGSSSGSDFDVSLRCSVSSLTPFTLNLSMIEPEHTVKLAIGCFGGDLNTADRSTLRQDTRHSSAQLHSLAAAPFEHLRFLNTLTIDSCKLDTLPANSLRGLPSLRNLTIRNAVYSPVEPFTIEMHSFRPVEAHLEYLDLGANQIGKLPADLFCPFVNLRTLNLTGNSLLDLSSFGLIDPATGRLCLQELHDLDLSLNKLELVPENSGVATLRNLKFLNLSSNHISEIAELAFSALKNLNVLDLSGNQLRSLPGRLFRDSEMTVLRLANNGLMELPSGLFKMLAKLLVLDVSGNQITSETLNKETFADLIRLVVLDLSNNRLRHINAFTFQNQYSLQVLSLEGNDLETVEDGAFVTLYNLHTLKLARNRFRHLSDSALTGLFMLNTLSLASNQLEHVHEDAFRNCTNLQVS